LVAISYPSQCFLIVWHFLTEPQEQTNSFGIDFIIISSRKNVFQIEFSLKTDTEQVRLKILLTSRCFCAKSEIRFD
jgi:hypothetical protein